MAMTETEWLRCKRPEQLLPDFCSRASDRKRRLFICACCRRAWNFFESAFCSRAVELSERFADGAVSESEMENVRRALPRLSGESWPAPTRMRPRQRLAVHLAQIAAWPHL